MAGRGRGARLKGSNFERSIAHKLTEATGLEWHRGLGQTRNGGAEVSDVESDDVPFIHIECKKQKTVSIKRAYKQAIEDIEQKTGSKKEAMPVIITQEDRAPALVTMNLEDWLPMFDLWLKHVNTQKTGTQ